MTVAETTKTGQHRRNAAALGGIPDLSSFSSCWGWGSPLQLGVKVGAAMEEECVG